MSNSAHIAMSLLLAIFPFVLVVLTITGMVSARIDPDAITDLIFGTWPKPVAEPILSEVNKVTAQSSGGTLTLSLLLALFFASNGVEAIRNAISRAYRDQDDRPFWRGRLLSLGFVLAGAVILVLVAGLQVVLPIYANFVGVEQLPGLTAIFGSSLFRNLVTVAVLIGALFACHIWLPGLGLKTRDVWPGVLLTVVLWWLVAFGFTYYLTNLANYSVTYAGLAGIMASIIFLNFMAAIFILGAEFNAQLKETVGG